MRNLQTTLLTLALLALLALALTPLGLGAAAAHDSDAGGPADPSGASGTEVRVMTYNIRYDEPRDGGDAWPARRAAVVARIEAARPDVLGVQEALAHQVEALRLDLARYGVVSRGRDGEGPDGDGERCAIYFDKARFTLGATGTFWLSPTPAVPSRGWDAALNRIATWAQLLERETGRPLLVVNTHFDHRGEEARRESARLVAARMRELARGGPAVLLGDFNFEPTSTGYATLAESLEDAGRASASGSAGPVATFTGFGQPSAEKLAAERPRIDHIFVPPGTVVLAHAVLAEEATDARFASDHRPVIATLAPWPVARATPAAATTQAADARRPNIVFLFSDDHAPHAIGAYARDPEMPFGQWLAGVDTTPRIDQLAAQGMRFRRSFCTNSICGPSRAVIQTGKHSHLNGFMSNGNRFDGDQQTFPKLLQGAGYRTAMIGKWHLGSDPQGFDYWDVLPGQGQYYNPVLINANGRRTVEGYCTDVVTDLALDWLADQKDSGQPFLLMCQHKAPHRTWMPALRHLSLYDDMTLPEPPTLFADYAHLGPAARFQEMTIARDMNLVYDLFVSPSTDWDPKAGTALDQSGYQNLARMTPDQRSVWDAYWNPLNDAFRAANLEGEARVRWMHQRYLKNYLRCVRGVDESVGRVLDWLEAEGLADNTIVVYSSDQGFYLGDNGWYDKRWMYEESLSMPLIVRWPGVVAPGAVDDHLVQNLDYAETLLEAAGVAVPSDMQGRSLMPLLRGEAPDDWRESIYYHYYEYPASHMVSPHCGVRTERWKLVHYYPFDEWELFDLQADPDEQQNLFGQPEHAATAAKLAVELGRLQAQFGDQTAVGPLPVEEQTKLRSKRSDGS
ncbi:MAG: sulfatase-like hydrolase/transferase [Planctomycetota bacterium]